MVSSLHDVSDFAIPVDIGFPCPYVASNCNNATVLGGISTLTPVQLNSLYVVTRLLM